MRCEQAFEDTVLCLGRNYVDIAMKGTNRIRFLNTYVDNLTASEARDIVAQLVQREGHHYVVSPNTDIVMKMQDDLELKQACENADLILTDGQVVVKLSRWLGNPIKERVSMTDFVWDVCGLADERGYGVFLFGGKEEALEKAAATLKGRYPGLNIVGFYSPPFGFEEDQMQLDLANKKIAESGADILIVFLGCPKQEMFIYRNRHKYKVPVSITMGGCVDFLAGSVKRAPKWMQDAGLEWFFRFLQEPARMFKRYFVVDARIFLLALRQKLANIASR